MFLYCRLYLNKLKFLKGQINSFISYSYGMGPKEMWLDEIHFPFLDWI